MQGMTPDFVPWYTHRERENLNILKSNKLGTSSRMAAIGADQHVRCSQ